ncbi:unnamed protein product [Acanthoscelides obtectus]|uniref:Glucosylceramidase n=1 Tax=Acanthoscelides obtectus TaxID=200917 RepID=A0A9P0K4H0_ACAOB|nr:unnamed protein product [Acanthoscelides obtectus]CAK1640415.1 Glucosylceramidase [Acanthoscelides obtectus]
MNYVQWLVLVAVLVKGSADQCLSRNYGNGGTVCVCNAEHCDTVRLESHIPKNKALVYTSNKDGLRFQKTLHQIVSKEKGFDDEIIVGNQTFQEIVGFGGAITDSTAMNILSMDKKLQEEILRSYYSKDGIEYNLARVPIGGTDFSSRKYTYVSEKVDPHLKSFKLQPEDVKYKVRNRYK